MFRRRSTYIKIISDMITKKKVIACINAFVSGTLLSIAVNQQKNPFS